MKPESIDRQLDTCGTCCPMPMVNTNKAVKSMSGGQVLEVVATDPATRQDIPDWCHRTGHELIHQEAVDGKFLYYVKKQT